MRSLSVCCVYKFAELIGAHDTIILDAKGAVMEGNALTADDGESVGPFNVQLLKRIRI